MPLGLAEWTWDEQNTKNMVLKTSDLPYIEQTTCKLWPKRLPSPPSTPFASGSTKKKTTHYDNFVDDFLAALATPVLVPRTGCVAAAFRNTLNNMSAVCESPFFLAFLPGNKSTVACATFTWDPSFSSGHPTCPAIYCSTREEAFSQARRFCISSRVAGAVSLHDLEERCLEAIGQHVKTIPVDSALNDLTMACNGNLRLVIRHDSSERPFTFDPLTMRPIVHDDPTELVPAPELVSLDPKALGKVRLLRSGFGIDFPEVDNPLPVEPYTVRLALASPLCDCLRRDDGEVDQTSVANFLDANKTLLLSHFSNAWVRFDLPPSSPSVQMGKPPGFATDQLIPSATGFRSLAQIERGELYCKNRFYDPKRVSFIQLRGDICALNCKLPGLSWTTTRTHRVASSTGSKSTRPSPTMTSRSGTNSSSMVLLILRNDHDVLSPKADGVETGGDGDENGTKSDGQGARSSRSTSISDIRQQPYTPMSIGLWKKRSHVANPQQSARFLSPSPHGDTPHRCMGQTGERTNEIRKIPCTRGAGLASSTSTHGVQVLPGKLDSTRRRLQVVGRVEEGGVGGTHLQPSVCTMTSTLFTLHRREHERASGAAVSDTPPTQTFPLA
ncbi:uncharacterized protein EHS24_001171 [Apiotrichum porosum]|uniref:Uncharacterized protein n=1 Tax=Apiotrichum porosum TaxID=105984 RepID=A0A427XK17_9TREE|nr:uncharacterized protein EHS24_001171 [Apiotrichum porosum]RSH79133.1 hypothetical protein EHS24_001171 [Apiotrichum porosum]